MRLKEIIKRITPRFLIGFYHYTLSFLGALFYGFPSKKIKVIGVTGTNGKSTVVNFVTRIFEEEGLKTCSLSSIRFKIGEKEWENKLKMTMPGRFKLQRFLKKALKEGCSHAALEVTSEGIKQYRHQFVDFEAALITNLTPEHIESHGGFEKYREAKLKLFEKTKRIHIVNLDDKNKDYFLEKEAEEKYGFTLENKEESFKTLKASRIEEKKDGISFQIENQEFNLKLLGRFNVANALAAVCAAISQNISLETSSRALSKAKKVPGRMEVVSENPFVVVDYAFTPAALEKVYKTVKKAVRPPKMICVLGACGGGRDKWKRPVLGKIASERCQKVIVTNEDPYDEDPMEIINQVAEGTEGKAEKILDRRDGIKKALKEAGEADAVVITGKGSEPWMCVEGGKKIPWDDREIVRRLLSEVK